MPLVLILVLFLVLRNSVFTYHTLQLLLKLDLDDGRS
jgi:hypothetical protein